MNTFICKEFQCFSKNLFIGLRWHMWQRDQIKLILIHTVNVFNINMTGYMKNNLQSSQLISSELHVELIPKDTQTKSFNSCAREELGQSLSSTEFRFKMRSMKFAWRRIICLGFDDRESSRWEMKPHEEGNMKSRMFKTKRDRLKLTRICVAIQINQIWISLPFKHSPK